MNLRFVGFIPIIALAPACAPMKPLILTAEPAHARIFRYSERGDSTVAGTGSAPIHLNGDRPVRVLVAADGFRPASRTLTKADAAAGTLRFALSTWRFNVNVDPFDAVVRLDGEVQARRAFTIEVERDKSRTLEISKPGFRKVVKRYVNAEGAQPPVVERFELTERAVLVTAAPAGATIELEGKAVGENTAEIPVPRGGCATVRVRRDGFYPTERRYCEGAAFAELPLADHVELRDRMVVLTVDPANADILVAGRRVGAGQFNVIVRQGSCTEVKVRAAAYATQTREYCNGDNAQAIPLEDLIKLPEDESYKLSLESDQANVNFTVEVNPRWSPDDAWKVMSQIVTGQFDVLEVTDKDTGYLRTGWNVRRFSNAVVRTRVLIKLADSAPLKYTIKLVSERADDGAANVKDDELFAPWNRILLQYRDVVNEAQSRLR
jgi:hypothetical protein